MPIIKSPAVTATITLPNKISLTINNILIIFFNNISPYYATIITLKDGYRLFFFK